MSKLKCTVSQFHFSYQNLRTPLTWCPTISFPLLTTLVLHYISTVYEIVFCTVLFYSSQPVVVVSLHYSNMDYIQWKRFLGILADLFKIKNKTVFTAFARNFVETRLAAIRAESLSTPFLGRFLPLWLPMMLLCRLGVVGEICWVASVHPCNPLSAVCRLFLGLHGSVCSAYTRPVRVVHMQPMHEYKWSAGGRFVLCQCGRGEMHISILPWWNND